ILFPPVFGGKVTSFDATKAKQVKGVIDVVQVPRGIAVVADTSWAAFQGKAALTVAYDNGSFAESSTRSLKARFLELAASGAGAIPAVARGSASTAGKQVEAVYFGNPVAHATMEPQNATASVTADGVEHSAATHTQTIAHA